MNTLKKILQIFIFFKIFFFITHFCFAAISTPSSTSEYQIDDNAPQILQDLILLLDEKNYEDALDTAKKAVKYYPDSADAWNFLGYTSRKMSLFEESKKAYTTALEIDPEHKGALEYFGELYLLINNLEKAEEFYSKLKKLCMFNCKELKKLESAISEYKNNN